MRVSVVLVAYHGDPWLPACLSSLAGASRERLHLVLVDNAGNEGIDALPLSKFDTEVLQTPRPMGFAEANNHALVNADRLEQVVLFLNQDTISPPGWIDACVQALGADEEVGAVSPFIRTYDDDGWDPSFLDALPASARRAVEGGDVDEGALIFSHEAPAPALLVRREALAEAGPFDPIFGSYYEDYDLCRRLHAVGFRVAFQPSARVRHFSGSTTDTPEKERRRMRLILRNRLIHRIRSAQASRAQELAAYLALDVPRRLLRGLLGTPSSQPPEVVLGALRDLWAVRDRLLSARADAGAWRAYLAEIGWAERFVSSPVRVTS